MNHINECLTRDAEFEQFYLDWAQHAEEVGCAKWNNNGYCTKLSANVKIYNSKGVARSTNNYGTARTHIS